MSSAVQQGKKTSATIPVNDKNYKEMESSIPETCGIVPYFITNTEVSMAYIYRRGTLSDYFDFEEVKKVYTLHGIRNVDWETVFNQFSKPMDYFADEKKCGFDIQAGSINLENTIILGLLLGYPIESTVAFLKNDTQVFGNGGIPSDVRKHFCNSTTPYVDQFGVEWHGDGKLIYQDGQQEALFGIHP